MLILILIKSRAKNYLKCTCFKRTRKFRKKEDLDNQYKKILRESGLENQLKGINNKIQSLKTLLTKYQFYRN